MDTKAWYTSATVQGVLASLLGTFVTHYHLPIGGDEIQAAVAALLTLFGLGWAFYGRMRTNGEKITL